MVREFCTKHPEMVNFQSNHACDTETDEPYGYFGYSPLMTFAGGQAYRRKRGLPSDAEARKGSVEVLLQHGARIDMHHGGHTSLEWMLSEGSRLIHWLQVQLETPMVDQAPFHFSR